VISFTVSYENNDSTVVIQPASPLNFITKYNLSVSTDLKSQAGGLLQSPVTVNLITAIDLSDKFPVISDNALLDLIQQQTFKYFLLKKGLLTGRQFFNGTDAAKTCLRNDINLIWNSVEWNWFRQNNQNVLFWHWSPNYYWDMNVQIKGWNESLITYVLAASST